LWRESEGAERLKVELIDRLIQEIAYLKFEIESAVNKRDSDHKAAINRLTAELESVKAQNGAELAERKSSPAEAEHRHSEEPKVIQGGWETRKPLSLKRYRRCGGFANAELQRSRECSNRMLKWPRRSSRMSAVMGNRSG
jgi:hypothetical protein